MMMVVLSQSFKAIDQQSELHMTKKNVYYKLCHKIFVSTTQAPKLIVLTRLCWDLLPKVRRHICPTYSHWDRTRRNNIHL